MGKMTIELSFTEAKAVAAAITAQNSRFTKMAEMGQATDEERTQFSDAAEVLQRVKDREFS
jgi:hypothetical protein